MKLNGNVVLLIILMMTALLLFTMCDNGGPAPENCDCADKGHLGIGETCNCGKANCTCTLKVYGEVVDNGSLGEIKIPIYRQGEVTDMATAVAKVIDAYGGLDDATRGALYGKIQEVRIIPGVTTASRSVENGKFIIVFGEERSMNGMRQYFNQAADNVDELAGGA